MRPRSGFRECYDRHSRIAIVKGGSVNQEPRACESREYNEMARREGATSTSSPSLPPAVMANKRHAPVAILSPTKRAAIIECFSNNGLHKQSGYWCGTPEGKHISGVTVADLARDGMFSVERNLPHGSAFLTERGQWFAQTLIDAANQV